MSSIDLERPWRYPLRAHFDERVLELVEMTSGSFELLQFHDIPHLRRFEIAERWSFERLAEVAAQLRGRARPPRYIFHSAFSGSTLLARYLDCPELTFSYREPAILTHLNATFHSEPDRFDAVGRAVLGHVVTLLTRTRSEGEIAVSKGSDVISPLAGEILEAFPGSRAIHIASEFEPFMTSCLESEERRTWVQRRVELLRLWAFSRSLALTATSDAEAAACIWLLHRRSAEALERDLGMLRIDMESLLARPIETAALAAERLELPIEPITRNVERMLADPTHAKSTRPYDLEEHRRRKAQDRDRLAIELDAGRAWIAMRS